MANGQVGTGFSKPFIAKYSNAGTVVTYTNGMDLARGVDNELSIETSDANIFYADNVEAESAGARFTGGTVSITVDGLLYAARKLAFGITNESTLTVNSSSVKVLEYDDEQEVPYLGYAFVQRVLEDGVTYYVPIVLPKIQFTPETVSAATQEEEIDWQTTALEANIFRSDDEKHRWLRIAERQTTEAAAVAVYKAMLGIS